MFSAEYHFLQWWIANLLFSCKAISHGEADIVIQTDASSQGWGGVHGDQRAGGRWTPTEALNHINYLELLAIFLSLKALCGLHKNKHIQVQCDNTTAATTEPVQFRNNQNLMLGAKGGM